MQRTILILSLLLPLTAAAEHHTLDEKLMQAMSADVRSVDEVARDENRKPVETLNFFGLADDMRVLELLPGGGWYTKLLAPVLKDNGELYVALGTDRVRDQLVPLDGFGHVQVLEPGVELVRDGPFGTRSVAPFSFGVSDLDMVLTFRNMHNFTPDGRGSINNAVFESLKSGGLYGVVDHSRRHMAELTGETRRRADVVEVILEVQAAGFVLVGSSDLHYRPDDELVYEVGRKTVTGNTDRFTLLFRKP